MKQIEDIGDEDVVELEIVAGTRSTYEVTAAGAVSCSPACVLSDDRLEV